MGIWLWPVRQALPPRSPCQTNDLSHQNLQWFENFGRSLAKRDWGFLLHLHPIDSLLLWAGPSPVRLSGSGRTRAIAVGSSTPSRREQ